MGRTRLFRKPRKLLPERDYVPDFCRYYIEELNRAPRTAESYRYSIRAIEKFSGKPAHKVTSDDLRAFKRSDYAPATKQQIVVAMHQFHEWGVLEGLWPLGDLSLVRSPRVPEHVRAPVSLEVAQQLLNACERPLEYRVIYYGLYAGCRISESAAMSRKNWQMDRLVFVGKGSKERTVPLHPELLRVRDFIIEPVPASVGVLHSTMARLRDRLEAWDLAGNPVTTHSLRRTMADSLYSRLHVPREVVAALLGHGSEVTDRYAPVRFPALKEAIDALSYRTSGPSQTALDLGRRDLLPDLEIETRKETHL